MRALPKATEDALRVLAQFVEESSGQHFSESRRSEFAAKCTSSFGESGCVTWDEYLARLRSSAGKPLLERLLEALTVGETYFFRDRPSFELLESEVLPEIIERKGATEPLRFWCAGCATGEEAYSLAIVLRRLVRDLAACRIGILATDMNQAFLRRAEAGLYGDWSFRETDDAFRAAHFTKEGPRYRIRPEIAGMVRFGRLNLAEDYYPSPANGTAGLDLILCRNVLLYFKPHRARQVLARLRESLAPDGWLALGPNDTAAAEVVGFETHRQSQATIYRRGEGGRVATRLDAPAESQQVARHMPAEPLVLKMDNVNTTEPQEPVVLKTDDGNTTEPGEPVVLKTGNGNTTEPEEPFVLKTDSANTTKPSPAAAGEGRVRVPRGSQLGEKLDRDCASQAARQQAEPYYRQGMLCHAQGDGSGAVAAFRRALYIDRVFVPAHLGLASVYRESGHPKAEQQALARAGRLLIDRPDDEVLLAEEGLTVGRLRDALAQIQDVSLSGGAV